MRTRDAVRDEEFAVWLALESGSGASGCAPFVPERDGWKGQTLTFLAMAANGDVTEVPAISRREYRRAIERHQRGSLARLIWESLPYVQKWWMYGETEEAIRKARRRETRRLRARRVR